MTHRTFNLLFALLLWLAAAGAAPAHAAQGTGDLWEDTMELNMPGMAGMPARAQTHRRCSARNADAVPMAGKDNDCEMSDLKRSATGMAWKMSCAGDPPTTGNGEMVYEGRDRYRGTMTINTGGRAMTMKMSGKRIGECDAAEAARKVAATQRQVAAAQHQAADATAMVCKGAVDGMMSQSLRPDSPHQCGATYKADFCRRLQTSEGFATVAARHPAAVPGIGSGDLIEAAAFCGVDAEQTRARFCKPAEQQESLDLLASSCVAHGYGRAIVVRECAGRTFSSPPAERYRNFCSAVARTGLMQPAAARTQARGQRTAAAPAAAEPQAVATPQQAAVETGKQLLKGLFGR
jgi:hypothetical protein